MFSNTTALDIAIGLILVYFIYSILVSIIGEMLASWCGIRARLLRQGINNLLNDKRPGSLQQDLGKWLMDSFSVEPGDFKFTAAGRFYQEPPIRSLAKRGENKIYSIRNTKPSYISKELYASTLLKMFNRKGRGVTEKDRVAFAVETNALHFEPETHIRFKEMLDASNGEYLLFTANLEDSFSEMMDRVNGWYKRKLGFVLFWLGFIICATLNVDTFQIVHILSNNPKARHDMVKLAQEAVEKGVPAERLMHASGDSSAYDLLLEEGYARAIQDAREVEFLLAKGWPFKGVQEQMTIKNADVGKVNELLSTGKSLKIQIDACRSDIDSRKSVDLQEDIRRYYVLRAKYRQEVLDPVKDILNKPNYIFNPDLVAIASEQIENNQIAVTFEPNFWERLGFVLGQVFAFWKPKFWGIVLSALALSLGANFWFDLLKRLVSLRSAGVKPEEKQGLTTTVDSITKSRSDGTFADLIDPIEKALSDNRKYWENLRGVVAVNRAVMDVSGEKREGIEMIVNPDIYLDRSVPRKLMVELNKTQLPVYIHIVHGTVTKLEPNTVSRTKIENCIEHDATKVWGTATGMAKDKDNNTVIISCGHVLRSDSSGYIKDKMDSVNIYRHGLSEPLGTVTNIILSNYIDAGIIRISKDKVASLPFQPIPKVRSVQREDAESGRIVSIKTLKGDANGVHGRKGKIYLVNRSHAVSDKTQNFVMYGLFLIKNETDDQTPLTQPGDSGSLVLDEAGEAIGIHIGSYRYDQTINDKTVSIPYYVAINLEDVMRIFNLKTI